MADPNLQAPTADFSMSASSGDAPLSVVFTDASTGTINGYAWSFGDGETSNDKNPTHIFDAPGNYTVSLTVFNEAGSTTKIHRVDVGSPAADISPDRAETVGDLIPSIRASLRRPSDAKLHYRDILDVLNDLLRGYLRDLNVSEQDHRTDESQCILSPLEEKGNDYLLTIDGVAEVEPMQLQFAPSSELANPTQVIWREMAIVPLDYFTDTHIRQTSVCSFYGSQVVQDGIKLKTNVSREIVEQSVWRIRYRVPILKMLTLASKTPLPADFLPMVKTEAVLLCLPRMRDDSADFYQWRKSNEPVFLSQVADWRRRWAEFIDTSNEPKYLRKIPANDYRHRYRRGMRYTVERW